MHAHDPCGAGKTHANMQSIVGIRRELREQLAQRYTLEQGRILTHNTSEDGTRKFLMQFGAGQEIESALPVPHRDFFTTFCSQTCSSMGTYRRVHPRVYPRHAVRLFAGRLHAVVQLLPHWNAACGTNHTHLRRASVMALRVHVP
jgi:hypothetical protein